MFEIKYNYLHSYVVLTQYLIIDATQIKIFLTEISPDYRSTVLCKFMYSGLNSVYSINIINPF